MARFCERLIQDEPELDARLKPKHLDTSALDTPALALANAARETLRMGDAMETMLEGLQKVMHGEPREEKELRRLADDINVLYTAIKLYLARIPQDELAEEESRRWAEIIEMSLNRSKPPISWSVWGVRLQISHWQHVGHSPLRA